MRKFLAVINVIAWAGFWAFGYLALAGEDFSQRQLIIASALAFVGFGVGIFTYLRLCCCAEDCGYAKKTKQLDAETRNRAQSEHPL